MNQPARQPKVSNHPSSMIPGRKKSLRRKIIQRMAWLLVGIIGWTVIWTAYYYPKAKAVVASARQAQQIAKVVPQDLSDQKFVQAETDVAKLAAALKKTDQQLGKMRGLRYWPYIGTQFRAVERLVSVGQDSTQAVGSLVEFVQYIFRPFANRGKVSLATITPEEKGALLAGMAERKKDLQDAKESIKKAAITLDKIPDHGLIGPLQEAITPLKQQFPLIQQGLDQAIPATELFPKVLGYPTEKNYLFLLENNSELRPAGGFIGTYGEMRVFSGEITALKTDNVYNLDDPAKHLPVIEPPAPLKKYLKAPAWYFRDSNWSPDFPTAARQALFMYERQGGRKDNDGVIGLTPTAIESLLRLVGSIKVDGIEFTADNLIERLEFQVEKGYVNTGAAESGRKDIIGRMTKQLVDRLLKLPVAEWKDVFLVLSQELNRKQLLLYMRDSAEQSIIEGQDWGGSIQTADQSDYLMVVDANLASLKTDLVMKRNYQYVSEFKNGRAEVTLTIHYQNTGKFDWKTTRYNTYVRVYVPNGSELLDSKGAQLRERSNAAGQVTTSTELGKTVFAAFKSIEPGQSSQLVLRYVLPDTISKTLQRQYALTWQKQPGMVKPMIELNMSTGQHQPALAEGLDNQARFKGQSVLFTGTLDQDRAITVSYR